MNKIRFLPKLLSNIAANSRTHHRLIVNRDLIRRANTHQLIRFFSDTPPEEAIENEDTLNANAVKDTPDPLEHRRRTRVIPPETSIKYMKSESYRETYGHYKVWHLFRRNFKGQFSPFRSRDECITEGVIWTSNPCPVCRDEYLVLHYTNLDLLKQFINPHTGYVYENTVLCLCSQQYEQLLVAINLAKNYGLLTFELPLRTYDYKEYYKDFHHKHNCNEHKLSN